jgi:RNA polymerase sigma factor (sigma-70 family)
MQRHERRPPADNSCRSMPAAIIRRGECGRPRESNIVMRAPVEILARTMMKKNIAQALSISNDRKRQEETRQFSLLIASVRPSALRYARFLSSCNDQGEDLFQVAAVTAWRNFTRLRDRAKFRSWFFQIIKRSYLSYHRTCVRRNELLPLCDDDAYERIMGATSDSAADDYQYSELFHALADLAPERRDEWLLYVLGGFSVFELSQIQGCSRACIEKRLERTRKKLAEIITSDTYGRSRFSENVEDNVFGLVTQACNGLSHSRRNTFD